MLKMNEIIRGIQRILMRRLWKPDRYLRSRCLSPISRSYGFDRGNPIDRFYIERFLEANKDVIKGRCLEIGSNYYTIKFGRDTVHISDVLDFFPNSYANIRGDIRNLSGVIDDNTYDCIILTQLLNVVDDYESSLKECQRILKPGGVILATVPTISPAASRWTKEDILWRFSPRAMKYLFMRYFSNNHILIAGFGNRKMAEYFLVGLAIEEIPTHVYFDRDDVRFPVIVTVKAIKG